MDWYFLASLCFIVDISALPTYLLSTNGRDPTFWLDKTCIEDLHRSRHISDGLHILPVNVTACKPMLAAWGQNAAVGVEAVYVRSLCLELAATHCVTLAIRDGRKVRDMVWA